MLEPPESILKPDLTVRLRKAITNNSLDPEYRKRHKNYIEWFEKKNFEALLKKIAQVTFEEAEWNKEYLIKAELERAAAEKNKYVEEWLRRKNLEDAEKMRRRACENADTQIKKAGKSLITFEMWLKTKKNLSAIERRKTALEQFQALNENQEITKKKTIADAHYEQWKNQTSFNCQNIPKNGFQIFGPKPTAVVKEGWIDYMPSSPNSTHSLPCFPARPAYYINRFRSEAGPVLPKLQLVDRSLIPWSWKRGTDIKECNSSQRTYVVERPIKKKNLAKNKPPFR